MVVLTKRSRGYIYGLVLFVIGTVVFVTGFATSYWDKCDISVSSLGRASKVKVYSGLWTVCKEADFGGVHCVDYEQVPARMLSVRALQCLALLFMFLSLCYAVAVNCLLGNAKFLRVLEVCAGTSGGLGLIGAIVFATEVKTHFNSLNANIRKFKLDMDMELSLGWSFGVNVGGAFVILLSSVLIACFNKPIDPQAAANSRESVIYSTVNGGESFVTVGGGVGATAPVPMGNNPYVTPVCSYPPPSYSTLQREGQFQSAVIAMPTNHTED